MGEVHTLEWCCDSRSKGTGSRSQADEPPHRCMVELVAVGVVLVALALLLDCVSRELVPVEPEERLDPGLAVLTGVLSVGVPDGRRADRFAPP